MNKNRKLKSKLQLFAQTWNPSRTMNFFVWFLVTASA